MVQDITDRHADTVLLAGQAVDRATVQGLKSASAKSGVSFQYLVAKAAQESSLKTDAQAETSSAAGLFQFTRGTWLDMVKRYGNQYGFGALARQIFETPNGKLVVADAEAEQKIMALRQDPEASGIMAAEYARDNASSLQESLGREPNTTDLYLAHFLGAGGAASLLTAADSTPDRSAAALVPAAAKANPAVFNTADGHPRSAAEVVKLMHDRFAGQMERFASADTEASDAMAAPVRPLAPPPATTALSKIDLRQALADSNSQRSPATLMMLDQLIKLIAGGPMNAADEENESDPVRPLSAAGLHGSDFADAMSATLAPMPRAPDARRAYGPGPGNPQALDDVI